MPDGADLSLPAIATLFAEFQTELDLHQVTLVCNDWGGAQLVISPGDHPQALINHLRAFLVAHE